MRKLAGCFLGVGTLVLRQPDRRHLIAFKHAVDWVRALVDFNKMAQYQSHTPVMIADLGEYFDRFHRMKDILLEFQVSKQTLANVDKEQKKLRHQRAQSNM